MKNSSTTLLPQLQESIEQLDYNSIPVERRNLLQPMIEYLKEKVSAGSNIRLNFICTHNSRRSHLSQIWAQAAAAYYEIPNVYCYSGGTEATALFPMVAETLKQNGFLIQTIATNSNPIYTIKHSLNEPAVIGFSKKYDDIFNPTDEFAALMTCSQADEGCPFIFGAEKRIPLQYEDPKLFDNTAEQATKYMERSLQIATEMCFVFSQIKSM